MILCVHGYRMKSKIHIIWSRTERTHQCRGSANLLPAIIPLVDGVTVRSAGGRANTGIALTGERGRTLAIVIKIPAQVSNAVQARCAQQKLSIRTKARGSIESLERFKDHALGHDGGMQAHELSSTVELAVGVHRKIV